jgi:hypothetical protein
MTSEARETVQHYLTDDERNAIKVAEDLYAGEAKHAAYELLTGSLAVAPEISTEVASTLGERMEELRFTDKREIADHLRAVANILGSVAIENGGGVVSLVREDVAVEPSDTQAEEVTAHDKDESLQPEVLAFDKAKNDSSNASALAKYGEARVRRITLLRGKRINVNGNILPISRNLTSEQALNREAILGLLMNNRERSFRSSELKKVAPTLGTASTVFSTLARHLCDQDGKTIVRSVVINPKLNEYSLADDLVIVDERLTDEEKPVGNVTTAGSSSTLSQVTEPEKQLELSEPDEEILPTYKACDLIAAQLGRTSHDEYRALRHMFEKGQVAPSKDVVDDVRNDIKSLYGMTVKSPFAILGFTQAETAAFEYILGLDRIIDRPLSYGAVESRMSQELAREGLTLDTVISRALQKFAGARQQIKDYEHTKPGA